MNVMEWIPVPPETGWKYTMINGTRVRVAPSPYDTPVAFRIQLDSEKRNLSVQFKYIVPSDSLAKITLETMPDASIRFEPASARVVEITIPYDESFSSEDLTNRLLKALEAFRVAMPKHQARQPDVPLDALKSCFQNSYPGIAAVHTEPELAHDYAV